MTVVQSEIVNFRITGVTFLEGRVLETDPVRNRVKVKRLTNDEEYWVPITDVMASSKAKSKTIVIDREDTGPSNYHNGLDYYDESPVEDD